MKRFQFLKAVSLCVFLCCTGCAYQRLSKVATAIDQAPVQGAYDVAVTQRNDAFVLTGEVASSEDRKIMESAVRSVAGPHSIRNDLLVNRELSAERSRPIQTVQSTASPDRDQVAKITNRHADDVEWSLRNNTVVLTGSAENHRQVDELLANLLMVPGVKDVESNIEVNNQAYMKHWRNRYEG